MSLCGQKTEVYVLKVMCLDNIWARDVVVMANIDCLPDGI